MYKSTEVLLNVIYLEAARHRDAALHGNRNENQVYIILSK